MALCRMHVILVYDTAQISLSISQIESKTMTSHFSDHAILSFLQSTILYEDIKCSCMNIFIPQKLPFDHKALFQARTIPLPRNCQLITSMVSLLWSLPTLSQRRNRRSKSSSSLWKLYLINQNRLIYDICFRIKELHALEHFLMQNSFLKVLKQKLFLF